MNKISGVLKIICLLSVILLCANIHGFSWFKKTPEPIPEQEKGIPKETREYTLKVGDTFSISLPENITTGYSWRMLVREPANERLIELVKTEYKSDSPEPMIGGGGTITFTFRAKKATEERRPGDHNPNAVFLYYCFILSGKVAQIVDMRLTITK